MSVADPTVRILIIQDDRPSGRAVVAYLQGQGQAVTATANPEDGLRAANERGHDVVLIDVAGPPRDSVDLCRELRSQSDVPVIVFGAVAEDAERLRAFEAGADEYIVKPFSAAELLTRIRALARRARASKTSGGKIVVGPLVLDVGARTASIQGKVLPLTSHDFSLLRVLAERAGQVVTREQLLALTDGSLENSFDRSIDVRISRLRQKLEADPRHPRFLQTVRGAGYMLVIAPADS